MIHPNFVIVGSVLNLFGAITYIVQVVKGNVKPNRVSWLLWGLAPLIAFSAELSQGVGIQSLMTFTVGFCPLLVFFASFINKKAYWKIGKLDIICGVLSVLALILWYVTKVGNIAIILSIISDGFAAIPTIRKAFMYPETENDIEFLMGGTNAAITLLTIRTWNFQHFGFPVYILLVNTILVSSIRFKLGKRFLNNSPLAYKARK